MRRLASFLAMTLFALGLSRPLAAEEGARFEYSAPPGCPSQAEFLSRVRERLLGASGGTPPIERRGLVVRVHVEPARGTARVEFQDANGARVARAVQGDDCDELVSGVALITALAFGSRAEAGAQAAPAIEDESAETSQQPDGSKPAEAARPETRKDGKLAPMAGPAKTRTVARTARPKPRAVPNAATAALARSSATDSAAEPGDRDVAEAPGERPPGWEAGAGGWVSSWLSPGRTLGADGFLRAGKRGAGWSARVSLAYGAGATTRVDGREADFSFLGGRVEGCPLSLVFSGTARLEPCLAAELGRLHGTGREDSALRVGQEQSVFWAAAVLIGRVRAAIGATLVVEAQAELGVPVTSHEFIFQEPETQVFSVPSFGGAGRIGVGLPF